MPKKPNLDPSNLLEEDPEFAEFVRIFCRYFYRPNPGFPPFGPLTPKDAVIPSAKLAAMFRHYQKPNEKPNPEVLMGSLQVVGFWLSLELESSMSTLREALKQHLHKSFCAAMEEFEIDQNKQNRLATRANASKQKPGPKGPRDASIARRTMCKQLKREKVTGRKACERLKELKIPLASETLRTCYGKWGWVEWFDQDPKAFYKQWSADIKRPSL